MLVSVLTFALQDLEAYLPDFGMTMPGRMLGAYLAGRVLNSYLILLI
jgi:hypothetical protein